MNNEKALEIEWIEDQFNDITLEDLNTSSQSIETEDRGAFQLSFNNNGTIQLWDTKMNHKQNFGTLQECKTEIIEAIS